MTSRRGETVQVMQDDDLGAPYLRAAIAEQDGYRAAPPSLLPRAMRSVARPMTMLTHHLVPAEAVEAAIRGADWVAAASIRARTLEHDVADLEACDRAADRVRRWAVGLGATGGASAGAFGAFGLAADVPATITLALRTVRLTGLSYGFGAASEAERVYILDILHLAGANSAAEKRACLARLAEARAEIDPGAWRKVAEMTGQTAGSIAATRRVAATLGVNLSARKAAQLAPVIGAAIGAGVNATFQTDIAEAARFAFRARWLEQNAHVIEAAETA